MFYFVIRINFYIVPGFFIDVQLKDGIYYYIFFWFTKKYDKSNVLAYLYICTPRLNSGLHNTHKYKTYSLEKMTLKILLVRRSLLFY